MILIDTSAWIEFLRDTGSAVCARVERELRREDIAVCDAITMEVLAGARDDRHLADLRGLLARATALPTTASDYDAAASLYRSCRRAGRRPRALLDCLIAAVALRDDAAVLHFDRDFDVLASVSDLAVVAA